MLLVSYSSRDAGYCLLGHRRVRRPRAMVDASWRCICMREREPRECMRGMEGTAYDTCTAVRLYRVLRQACLMGLKFEGPERVKS